MKSLAEQWQIFHLFPSFLRCAVCDTLWLILCSLLQCLLFLLWLSHHNILTSLVLSFEFLYGFHLHSFSPSSLLVFLFLFLFFFFPVFILTLFSLSFFNYSWLLPGKWNTVDEYTVFYIYILLTNYMLWSSVTLHYTFAFVLKIFIISIISQVLKCQLNK